MTNWHHIGCHGHKKRYADASSIPGFDELEYDDQEEARAELQGAAPVIQGAFPRWIRRPSSPLPARVRKVQVGAYTVSG